MSGRTTSSETERMLGVEKKVGRITLVRTKGTSRDYRGVRYLVGRDLWKKRIFRRKRNLEESGGRRALKTLTIPFRRKKNGK